MNKSLLGKVLGWGQFGLNTAGQFSQGAPHGWAQWLAWSASAAMAVGLHAASSTDGKK